VYAVLCCLCSLFVGANANGRCAFMSCLFDLSLHLLEVFHEQINDDLVTLVTFVNHQEIGQI